MDEVFIALFARNFNYVVIDIWKRCAVACRVVISGELAFVGTKCNSVLFN